MSQGSMDELQGDFLSSLFSFGNSLSLRQVLSADSHVLEFGIDNCF